MDHEEAKQVAQAFVAAVESGATAGVFADDVFVDINVPVWRFQMQGSDEVTTWLRDEQPNGCRIPSWRCEPTASGVVVEVEQRYDRDGQEISSRNLHLLEVRNGLIAGWTMYCSGEWDPELRERQAKEAPMFRP